MCRLLGFKPKTYPYDKIQISSKTHVYTKYVCYTSFLFIQSCCLYIIICILLFTKTTGGEFLAEKTALDWIALVLVIIGGLNWGLFGISQGLNLVALLFGYSIVARIVYILVGLSALYMVYYATKK
ncbi:MAG: hypothetical protein A4E23_01602 [Methanomethylovorans sp. PtaU1.Bin073]|nr:MAG: hypothetical protein A4E23_01602 [Methanomethylovorans sp. PtaU1.Bin073]